MTLKPRCIEVMGLISNLVAIGFLVWGLAEIPWSDIRNGGKITFFIGSGFTVITLLFIFVLMCFRCGNKINTTKNSAGKCICITALVFNFLALILIIIGEIVIIYDMYDRDYYDYYWDDYRSRRRYSYYSDAERAAAIISPSGAEIAIIIYGYCISFLLKLIFAKTDLSYLEYKETQDNSQNNIIARTIGVFNSPPNNNELRFLGYDQNGHPIYSGNTQYYTQQVITNNVNSPTVVTNEKK
jgi:hypothetical protein